MTIITIILDTTTVKFSYRISSNYLSSSTVDAFKMLFFSLVNNFFMNLLVIFQNSDCPLRSIAAIHTFIILPL